MLAVFIKILSHTTVTPRNRQKKISVITSQNISKELSERHLESWETFGLRRRDEEKLALLTRRESNQLIYRMGMLPLHHDNFQTGENLLISRAGSLHNNPVQCEDAAVFSPSQFFSWTVELSGSQIKQLKHC